MNDLKFSDLNIGDTFYAIEMEEKTLMVKTEDSRKKGNYHDIAKILECLSGWQGVVHFAPCDKVVLVNEIN